MAEAFPLYWPVGMPRTERRIASRFKTSITAAVKNVQDELRRFGNDTGHGWARPGMARRGEELREALANYRAAAEAAVEAARSLRA